MRFTTFGLPALLVAVALTTGCSTWDKIVGKDDNDSSSNRNTTVLRGNNVPTNAMRVAGGTGNVGYTANDSGMIYVVDAGTGRTLVSQQVSAGQRVAVHPSEDEILVDGQRVFSSNLESKNRHEIFFLDRNAQPAGSYQNPNYNNGTYNNPNYNGGSYNNGNYNNPNYNNGGAYNGRYNNR